MEKIITICAALLMAAGVFAQSPEKMSYQAVIRNASNNLVVNQAVGMQISVLQGSANGTAVYVETQTPMANANGLASIEIGNGTVVLGTFSAIDWANGPYFIKTETDPTGGTAYSITGASQLLSVPYALHAKTAESVTGYTETDPQFNVSVAKGITAVDTANWNNHFSGDYNDLSNTPTIPTVPTNVSAFTNDAGYITGYTETDPQFNASVAKGITAVDTANWNNHFSGDYNDLTNTPTIPTVPSNVSAFTNDAGYISSYTETDPQFNASVAKGITAVDTANWNNHFSGDYNDLSNTPTIPTVPSNVSAFTNDAGYITGYTETDPQFNASVAKGITAVDTANWNNHFSGDYNDLTNTPTIPAAADGSETKVTAGTNITITGSGTTASPYVVNATGGATLAIGDSYQGGIIFWLDATGQHGLIAATADQSTGIQWYNGTFKYTGTTGDGLYAGAMNTSMIVATQMADNQTGNFAAKVCADYSVTVGGITYGDWYLPSKYELSLL